MASLLGEEKAAEIAQSDKWTAWARVASVITPMILVPIGGFLAFQTVVNSQTMSAHTATLDAMQRDVTAIKGEVGPDHDALTVLRTQVDNIILQVQLLWSRPAQPAKGKP